MPRGLGRISQVAKDNAAKRAAYEQGGAFVRRFPKMEDGETRRVRFLEQGEEVEAPWCHQLPAPPGRPYGDWVMCLDPDDQLEKCAGCEREKSRSVRMVINLIWYDAPKIVRDKDGKAVKNSNDKYQFDGVEDAVFVWHRGATEGGRLAYLDAEHDGLTGNIFKIHRQGTGKDDTKYFIDFSEAKPPTPKDVELFKSKEDPRKALKEMSYNDMARAYSGGGIATSQPVTPTPDEKPLSEDNAFARASQGAVNRGAFG